ncbi:hypothetical protein N8D74_04995 [Curtobacterium flaccumfaciens]|uniref:Uncharacterized protein n=1 Tax=Curtobacterium poinsettiae TaxID=159612 RepID=A0A9Q9P9Q4_9MICO|nr:hypothetical protein [Curtobacterium flaccumfaciens]UXN26242.1 hypothetical protein N8D74_04995 [Curtobacterium flaccumfaciens]UYC81086.1 hypothetical protein OE229_01085 [Curtobacterium flaccumfaciens pv. poinsettiae]
MTELHVPVTNAMSRLDVRSDRIEIGGDTAPRDREDLLELGRLLAARGADAAWAILDGSDASIASWVALTVVPLLGTTPGVLRRGARHDDPIEVDEDMRNTALGPALRLRQRIAVPAPTAQDAAGLIVSESLDWSWVLPGDMMLSVNANTTQLVYADWVADQVDRVALGIDLVR